MSLLLGKQLNLKSWQRIRTFFVTLFGGLLSTLLLEAQTVSYSGSGTAASLADSGYAMNDASFDLSFEVPNFSTSASYMLFEVGATVHGTTIVLQNDRIVFYSQSPNNQEANRGALAITLPATAVGQTIQVRATIDRDNVTNTTQTLALSALIDNGTTSLTSFQIDFGTGAGPENITHSSQQWAGGNGVTHGQSSTGFAGSNVFPGSYASTANLPTAASLSVGFYNGTVLDPLVPSQNIFLSNVDTQYQLPADTFTIFDADLEGFSQAEDTPGDYSGVFVTVARSSGANSGDVFRIFSDNGVVGDHVLNGRVDYSGAEVGIYTVTNGAFRLDMSNAQGGIVNTAQFSEILQSLRIRTDGIFSEEYTLTISNAAVTQSYTVEICSVRLDLITKIQLAADQSDASGVSISDLFLASAYNDVRPEYLASYREEIESLTGLDVGTCDEIAELIQRVNTKQSALDRINAAHLAANASTITIQDLIDASRLDPTEIQVVFLSDYQTEIETLAQSSGAYDYLLDCVEVALLIAEVNKSDDNNQLLLVETGTNNDIGSVTAGGQDTGFSQKDATIDLNFRMLNAFDTSQNYVLLEYGGSFRGLTIGVRNNTLVLLNLNDSNNMALHEIPLTAADLGKQLSIRMVMDQSSTTLTTRVYLIGGDGRLVTSGPETLATTAWTGTDDGALGRHTGTDYSGNQSFNGSIPLPGVGNGDVYPINGNVRNIIYQLSPLVLAPPLKAQPSLSNVFEQKSQQVGDWVIFDDDYAVSDYSYQRYGDFDGATFNIERQGGGTSAEDYQFNFSSKPGFSSDASNIYYQGQVIATYTGGSSQMTITFDSTTFPSESSSSKLIDGRKITETFVNDVLQSIELRASSAGTYPIESLWTTTSGRAVSAVSNVYIDADQYAVDLRHHIDPVSGAGTDASQDYVGEAGGVIEIPFLIENSNRVAGGGDDEFILSVDNLPQGWSILILEDENEDAVYQNYETPYDGAKMPVIAFSKKYGVCRITIPENALGDPNNDGMNDFDDYSFNLRATSAGDSSVNDTVNFRVQLSLQQGAELYPDLELTATPLGVVEYIHTLTNYTEQPVQYALQVSHQVEEWKSIITDENRVAFPTTTLSGNTVPLVSVGARGSGSDQQLIRLRLFVPGQKVAGFTQVTSLSAIPVSSNTNGNELTVIDITEVVSGSVTLYKTLSSYSAQPGSVVEVTTEWKNLGSKAVSDVIFYESLPRNAFYVKGSSSFVFPASYAGGSAIENSSNGGIAWSPESGTGVDSSVTNVRIKLNSPIAAGSSGTYTYQIQIR